MNSILLDYHIHTTASDGQYSPMEIVDKVRERNVYKFAITDHDTIDGIEEAMVAAKKCDIAFIPGIEISVQDTEEIHIVGLGINHYDKKLREACKRFKEDRDSRGEKICLYLQNKGIPINLDEVLEIAGNGNLARPHFATWLLQHRYVDEKKEAYKIYLDTLEFHKFTDRVLPKSEQAIELIHGAGGKAILAHPGLYHYDDQEMDNLIARLKNQGIDGIECFYSRHLKKQIFKYIQLIKKYNIKTSIGSDYHGEKIKPDIELGIKFEERYISLLIM